MTEQTNIGNVYGNITENEKGESVAAERYADISRTTRPVSNAKETNLPHIRNIQSGIEKWDPVHSSIFEVAFDFPEAIASKVDTAILTEQVISVTGLDALQKTSDAGSQTFLGATVSFLNPVLDNTSADLTIKFNLNLKSDIDNFILRYFKKWANLGYDISSGVRTLKREYCADFLQICVANRDGSVWRKVIFYDVMLIGITGLDSLEYTNKDAATLEVKFRSDWWDDVLAASESKDTTNGTGNT